MNMDVAEDSSRKALQRIEALEVVRDHADLLYGAILAERPRPVLVEMALMLGDRIARADRLK